MNFQQGKEEYVRAMRLGQKQVRELTQAGKDPNPAVLDEILADKPHDIVLDIGLVEIPVSRIVGVSTAGRITAFSAGFLPILSEESEFATKWAALCLHHLSSSGIREPIECFEYLGNFYVQEGNKRVSVLKYYGASKIPGIVRRVMPVRTQEPRIQAYYEFLEFYKVSKLYDIVFRQPGQYAALLASLDKAPGEEWTQWERRTFSSRLQYFRDAYEKQKGLPPELLPEDALLLWLQIHSFQELSSMSTDELEKSIAALRNDMAAIAAQATMKVQTEPVKESKPSLLSRIIPMGHDYLVAAFVHQRDPLSSPWIKAHDEGRKYLERVFLDKIVALNYFHADTPELAEKLLDEAVADGAQVVFTTTPQLSRATLKAAVKYPRVRFLNCSADAPYTSVRSYYCRVYEGKFITGAIAGAMAENNRIGYIGSYPIFGVPASINAFALGAQMTNPRAKIELRWSCMYGNPVQDFLKDGIRVISNRDVPSPHQKYLEFGEYGTYMADNDGNLMPLASPCWVWGRLYENVIRAILSGSWEQSTDPLRPVNYWWGMDSGVIDVKLAAALPQGLQHLAEILRSGLCHHTVDPFLRQIRDQSGRLISDGSEPLNPDQLLHMDWLCDNIEGSIPQFEEVAPFARSMVRELGIYRDLIPNETEGTL